MSNVCANCTEGEYHGLPPADAPAWEVGTVYFWCPIEKHHDQFRAACDCFDLGAPKRFDKRGNEIKGRL